MIWHWLTYAVRYAVNKPNGTVGALEYTFEPRWYSPFYWLHVVGKWAILTVFRIGFSFFEAVLDTQHDFFGRKMNHQVAFTWDGRKKPYERWLRKWKIVRNIKRIAR